jgi:hypothetical protein
MWDGFNKRKFPRLALRCEVTILSDLTGKPLVTLTENVGIGGVCIILDHQLERFSKCRLRLELEEGTSIECDGRVVWAVPTQGARPNSKQYDTGIEFTGLDAETSGRIRQHLEAEIKKSPGIILK